MVDTETKAPETDPTEEVLAELQAQLSKHERESARHKKLVIVAWGGNLDRVWPTFILGTTGAAMGMETTIFFTFWGLFPLVKNQVRRGPASADPSHGCNTKKTPAVSRGRFD